MKTLSLILIGDIHFPEHETTSAAIDWKDKGFPPRLADVAAPTPLLSSISSVARLREQIKAELGGILFAGDLTSIGSLVGYQHCVDWLTSALRLNDVKQWGIQQIHVVPGNHDVDRTLCDPSGTNLFAKFVPLETYWNSVRLPVLACSGAREVDVSLPGCAARVFSLNSSIGCGETRYLPEPIRDQLSALLKAYTSGIDMDKAFALVGEIMDTPAFDQTHVHNVAVSISSAGETVLPVLLAHHNILPQAIPRINIYAEIVNAGLARARFTDCSAPVLYCHGHIHDDPVELIMNPLDRSGKSRLVSVSAPALTDGFEHIRVYYGSRRVPLGITLHRYRRQRHMSVELDETVRISLHPVSQASRLAGPFIKPVLRALGNAPRFFDEVVKKVRRNTGAVNRETRVADALLEAEWLGLVTITNRNDTPKHWRIEGTQP